MSKPELPKQFVDRCLQITAKRPRTVIDHILKHGFVTTEELKDKYGYNHPPRAARDVRESGIPLETFRVKGSDGRMIGAYRFDDPNNLRYSRRQGRTAFSKKLREELIKQAGCRCAIYQEEFPAQELQIDHRIPYEVLGDGEGGETETDRFMLLSGSANRAKSWSCEHCVNWRELKKPDICKACYWAYPESYEHVAMREIRRMDIVWSDAEVEDYEKLVKKTTDLQKRMPEYVKEVIRNSLNE